MIFWRLTQLVLAAIVLVAFPLYAQADAMADLDRAFRQAYNLAAAESLTKLRSSAPVLINRFGQIALYRPGLDTPEIYSMDMSVYLQARSVSHVAPALIARLAPAAPGPLDSQRSGWLASYEQLLANAAMALRARNDIIEETKSKQITLLETVLDVVKEIRRRGEVDEQTLRSMGTMVRPHIESNLALAATSQLEQFRRQIELWKTQYPSLNWNQAVVVIVGNHQARRNYLQRQFFDWMLGDHPDKEDRVVFAETLIPPAPLQQDLQPPAMVLLSKVMLDKQISQYLFDDPYTLQSDVLGGAAQNIIRQW